MAEIDRKVVNIYIMSSISSLRKTSGKIGYVIETLTTKGPATFCQIAPVQEMTASTSQMYGLELALSHMKKSSHLVIFSEDNFLKNYIEWIPGWKSCGWKKANGQEIANKSAWERIYAMLEDHEFEFRVKEEHCYRRWLKTEVEREGKNGV